MNRGKKPVGECALISLSACLFFASPMLPTKLPHADNSSTTYLPLEVSIGFFSWWWSDEALTKITEDYVPPHDKYAEIRVWGYSDPIEGPNSYIFDILADIKNRGDTALQELSVEVLYRWKHGPIENPAEGRWEEPATLRQLTIHSLAPGEVRQVKIEKFSIKKKLESLSNRSWPWALKVLVRIKRIERVEMVNDHNQVELVVEHLLPLIPGD